MSDKDFEKIFREKKSLEAENVKLKKQLKDLQDIEEQVLSLSKFPSENPNPILRIDVDGKILYMNEAVRKILVKNSLNEKDVLKILPDNLLELLKKAFSENKPFACEKQLNHSFYFYSITPIKEKKYLNIYGTNITLTKLADEKIRELSDRKSDFVFHIAHELKNTLFRAVESIKILLEREAGEINDVQEEMLTITKKSIDRLSRIVLNLLDLSRIESGKMKLDLKKLDIVAVIKNVIKSFKIQIEKNKINFIEKLPDKEIFVFADRDKLIEVFVNLFDNALKYTKEKDTVSIELKELDREIVCEIFDNGPGISIENSEKVFNKYEIVEDKSKFQLGLGLSIVKDILEFHRGKIWLDTKETNGCRFVFKLPKIS